MAVRSRYEFMLRQSYEVPWSWNLAAAISSWILLAGFLVLPGAFTSLQKLRLDTEASIAVHKLAQQHTLLGFAISFCILGFVGTGLLWVKYRSNYIWLLSRLFVPGLLNSASGLVTVLISVYTSQGGDWSTTADVTVSIVALCLCYTSVASVVYFYLIKNVGLES
ncbi:hypothetical protein B0J18DRAFT_374580 [Chaetomium sp. MPI-SDFR-AT-0129]|nr:hypothetical protein B0J18DRAFT_374580 [Chaetomium sp. MPI-SDFR-AT-0129]